MRGKAAEEARNQMEAGITPAYAGKSSVAILPACHSWDHPRLCGEKCTKYKLMICTIGSPPPMRGKD